MNELQSFGKNLRAKRQEKGIKQKDLAQMTGIAPQTLSGYEGRGILPPLENAVKLAQALGVSLDWLTGLSPEEKSAISGVKLKTKGDAARAIVALLDVDGVRLCNVCRNGNPQSEPGLVFDPVDAFGAFVTPSPRNLKGFVESLQKFEDLTATNALPKDMAGTAIEGLCKNLDDYPLKEELPF